MNSGALFSQVTFAPLEMAQTFIELEPFGASLHGKCSLLSGGDPVVTVDPEEPEPRRISRRKESQSDGQGTTLPGSALN